MGSKGMKSKAGLVVAVVCGLLAVGFGSIALAGGGTKVQGVLKGSNGKGKITMVVKRRRTSPTKLKNIRVTNLPYLCTDGNSGYVSSKIGSAHVRFEAEEDEFRFDVSHQDGPRAFTSNGTVSKDGRKVIGGINVAFVQATLQGSQLCQTYALGITAGHFKAKPRKK